MSRRSQWPISSGAGVNPLPITEGSVSEADLLRAPGDIAKVKADSLTLSSCVLGHSTVPFGGIVPGVWPCGRTGWLLS